MARAAALLAVLLLASSGTPAQEVDRHTAQIRLQELDEQIATLQRELEAARSRQQDEQAKLREFDLQLQAVARETRALAQELAARQAELERLRVERDRSLAMLGTEQEQLGAQLLAAWRLSRESRLKMVLNLDSPAHLGRFMGYYEHLGAAQAERIRDLRIALEQLDLASQAVDRELERVADAERRQTGRREELLAMRGRQNQLLEAIGSDLADEAARLESLQRDRRDLETLLDRLEDALADIPSDLGGSAHPRALRGRLPMPVKGPVAQAYGQPRTAGLRWQGWLIGAPRGAEVSSIAYGRVAYADWLRGYGLLIIVDHGEGFMSLYGHNESLLAEAGDWVQPGQTIATVGRNAEQDSGVYFELRSRGKALDPAAWIQRR